MRTFARLTFALISFGALLFLPRQAFADSTTTIDFEGPLDGTVVGSLYASEGVVFSGAVIITAGISLDQFDFPPHSGVNVVYDISDPITLTFSSPISAFSAFFTYTAPLTLEGFGSSDQLLASADSLYSENYVSSGIGSPNEEISLNASGITSLTIIGGPGGASFVMDDVTFTTPQTTVPEPGSLVNLMAGFLLIFSYSRRR